MVTVQALFVCTQIRDLNSGTFGFVQLARDKQTGELIAVKFIERGDKVWLGQYAYAEMPGLPWCNVCQSYLCCTLL